MKSLFQQYGGWGILGVVVVSVDIYVGVIFYQRFRISDHGGFWHKVMDSAYDSVTILVTKVWLLVNTILLFANPVAVFLAGPDGQAFMQSWIGDPKKVAVWMLIFNGIVYFSRMRTIDSATVPNPFSGAGGG